jgi:hypothetical protein
VAAGYAGDVRPLLGVVAAPLPSPLLRRSPDRIVDVDGMLVRLLVVLRAGVPAAVSADSCIRRASLSRGAFAGVVPVGGTLSVDSCTQSRSCRGVLAGGAPFAAASRAASGLCSAGISAESRVGIVCSACAWRECRGSFSGRGLRGPMGWRSAECSGSDTARCGKRERCDMRSP